MEEIKDTELRVLRLDDLEGYEPYDLPFQIQAAVEDVPFVDDLRANDDQSLDVVPRITTYQQLKDTFKLDIDYSLGRDSAANGDPYWAVIGFYLRTGIAAFIPKVYGENGQPLPPPGTFVWAHWPGAPSADTNPNYHSNAVGGFTNAEGDIGFGFSGGAVCGADGGVYDIWVSADPPGGTRFFSDMAKKACWQGSTNHLVWNPIFQAIRKGGPTPPPAGDSRLVVYDQQGNEVGYTPLISGVGTGGRIALVTEGVETSHTVLLR